MKLISFTGFLCIGLSGPILADELGRLYTTAEQRKKLQAVKYFIPPPEETEIGMAELEEIMQPVVEPEQIVTNALSVKGLVYRSDGRNAAWINDSNTYEGGLELRYIKIPEERISADGVTIILPGERTETIKVGKAFDPNDPNGKDEP